MLPEDGSEGEVPEGERTAVAREPRTGEGPVGEHTSAEPGAEVGLYRITGRAGARGKIQVAQEAGMQLAAAAARSAQARAGRACVGLALRLSRHGQYLASESRRVVVRFRECRPGGDRAVCHSAVMVVGEKLWGADEEAEMVGRFVRRHCYYWRVR